MKCSICDTKYSGWFNGKPYCNKHLLRLYKNGTTELLGRKSTNRFEIDNKNLIITTNNGVRILADAEDYELLKKPSWCISKTGYAVANINKKVVKMARVILGISDPATVVDHKNGDKLDNRKSNLRICSQRNNSLNQGANRNRILPVGIRITKFGKYNARIFFDGRGIHIGNFDSMDEAIEARNKAEDKYFRDFAQHLYRDNTKNRSKTHGIEEL